MNIESETKQWFSIRKLTIGVTSVLIGISLFVVRLRKKFMLIQLMKLRNHYNKQESVSTRLMKKANLEQKLQQESKVSVLSGLVLSLLGLFGFVGVKKKAK